MKKVLLMLSGCVLASAAAQADSPIQAGDLDLVVNPVGNTAAGLRYAVSENIAVFGLVDYFYRRNDEVESYNTSTEQYEDYSSISFPELNIKAGAQYFFMDGAYVAGDVGYYGRNDTEDFEAASSDDEETTIKTVFGNIILGFEQPLGERFAVHSEFDLEVGLLDSEYTETDDSGTQTDGSTTDRTYMETSFTFGLSYTLN